MSEEMMTHNVKTEVLIQALPFLKKYNGKTVVIKYGGNAMTSEALQKMVMQDIVLLNKVGIRVVLVHGGGPEITQMMKTLGKQPRFIDGLRVTDQKTVEIAQMVLAGKINKSLVNKLQAEGGLAVGLSGMDARLIRAKIRNAKYGFVGDVVGINTDLIITLIEKDYIPVVSTLGCDEEGNTYNINSDTAAGAIAVAVNAERMIMMSDIPGILEDRSDNMSLIREMTISQARDLQKSGAVNGGMIPKLACCIDAVENGVKAVAIIDGRQPHSVLTEILTNEGAGTLIYK